ncbi:MAG: flagellar export chaperone FliS [Candidatus Scalinduaceae bacterium]
MKTYNADSYKKSQVETADQLSLILMLYDRAISSIEKAKEEISEKKYEEKGNLLTKVKNIVFELLASLDKDKGGEIASRLSQLYDFVIHEITDAEMNLNTKALDNAKGILSELRNSWDSIRNNPKVEYNNTDNTKIEIDLSG